MDFVKAPFLLTALGVSGTFWGGFQEVLSKAAIPTTPGELGAALASLVLVLLPVAVQYAFKKCLAPPTSQEAVELFNQALAAAKAAHAQHVADEESHHNHVQPSVPSLDGLSPTPL